MADKRIYFSTPADSNDWGSAKSWIDYTDLRSWLRHPKSTFKWWRHPQAPRNMKAKS